MADDVTGTNDLTRRNVLTGMTLGALPLGAFGLPQPMAVRDAANPPSEVDYIVVGSGPGGAPVAARLAEAGYAVVVLEAGPDQGNSTYYDVPALWPRTVSDPAIRWDYFVRHYTDAAAHGGQFVPQKDGVLYPRAATLGGCSAHHAMVTINASPGDWSYLQNLTGDASFNPETMWGYWEKVLSWQPLQQVTPLRAATDDQVARLLASFEAENGLLPQGAAVKIGPDPNSYLNTSQSAQGAYLTPQNSRNGRRIGPRERLLAAAAKNPGLTILNGALAEKVLLERAPDGSQKAVGVQYLASGHLHSADPDAGNPSEGTRAKLRRTIRARKEVILAGGCYNSPQLLMLSGIGPAEQLRSQGIEVKVPLPGVGSNFQDRNEATVVTRLDRPLSLTAGCTLTGGPEDVVCMTGWQAGGTASVYGSNGAPFYLRRRYSAGSERPEVALLGVFGEFYNFRPGWVDTALQTPSQYLTWIVVKAYSQSRKGYVRLRSADPLDTPYVNKQSFDDSSNGAYDIAAISEGIEVARRINKRAGLSGVEVAPGTSANLTDYIRKEQFGHHGSCTNPIGAASDPMAVLDSKHRVRGTSGLRVVDASAFNRIPGSFIWAPTATLAERAADQILSAG